MATRAINRDDASGRVLSVAVFLGLLWLIALVATEDHFRQYGMIPRSKEGAIGILTMPLLHANVMHVAANTFTLGVILFQRALAPWHDIWKTTAFFWLATGAIAWAVHPDTNGVPMVGASALAFAWVAHSVIAFPSIITLTLLGVQVWSFWDLWQMMLLPNDQGVSWVGHWIGIAVGAWTAIYRGPSV